jgi:hypothetical protein
MNLITIITKNPGLDAKALSKLAGYSESRTREILNSLVRDKEVRREAKGRSQIHFVVEAPAPVEPPAKAAKAKSKKPAEPKSEFVDPDSGKGNPGAKTANPQPTIEVKRAACRSAGGDLTYAKRIWTAAANGQVLTLTADELAAHTVGSLCAALGVKLPRRDAVASSAGAAKAAGWP